MINSHLTPEDFNPSLNIDECPICDSIGDSIENCEHSESEIEEYIIEDDNERKLSSMIDNFERELENEYLNMEVQL